MTELTTAEQQEIAHLVDDMEAAWNRADAASYIANFEDKADFVVINGQKLKGRAEILAAHQAIFRSIYAGSCISYEIEQARLLAPEVAVVHIRAQLQIAVGPLAGEIRARPTLTLVRGVDGWRIASLQNTEIKELAPRQTRLALQ